MLAASVCKSIYLSYKSYFFYQLIFFSFHDKLTNGIFSYNFLDQQCLLANLLSVQWLGLYLCFDSFSDLINSLSIYMRSDGSTL
jgi:hypothetical protein